VKQDKGGANVVVRGISWGPDVAAKVEDMVPEKIVGRTSFLKNERLER